MTGTAPAVTDDQTGAVIAPNAASILTGAFGADVAVAWNGNCVIRKFHSASSSSAGAGIPARSAQLVTLPRRTLSCSATELAETLLSESVSHLKNSLKHKPLSFTGPGCSGKIFRRVSKSASLPMPIPRKRVPYTFLPFLRSFRSSRSRKNTVIVKVP